MYENEFKQLRAKRLRLFWVLGLVLLPLIVAAIFVSLVKIKEVFRYDQTYFAPQHREAYSSPGAVARGLERALQQGDNALYAELSALRRFPLLPEANPYVGLAILLDVDEHDYFHYMYFDVSTYLRQTHYIKEVSGRWIVSPQDAYFYYDSGQWLRVFLPLALTWWGILFVIGLGRMVYRSSARMRESMGR